MNKESLKNKRVAALDFGRRRIGFAVCDEFHITVSPRGIFFYENTDEFWTKLLEAFERDRIEAVVVGVPYRLDEVETPVIKEIYAFIQKLEEKVSIPVLTFDESFSTRKAYSTMHEVGMKKKKRQDKATKDTVAAAIILREFLNELEY